MTADRIATSLFKRQFVARTAVARERSGRSQEEMAADLGIGQGTYHKYEKRTPLPHHFIPQFCVLCQVSPEWLYTAAVELRSDPPRRPRRKASAKQPKVVNSR